ncbi:hypothetical protein [Saccharibacillus alkalitolerans]|uniref:Uncharacterized protein n=1 Tax=Saccharibacillus alkalitolerans TaxID=2705290 RepID=A0ABX0F915_9BACL|nr:hypothetical protein [Saccharibacillus alkalitolerans]NGZ76885.1 hypothetical protein [Saccharibacillus alkalitolerans]
MGCDIALYCEGRLDGKWINIDRWYRRSGWPEIKVMKGEGFSLVDLIDGARDYGLFYLLAGVRGSDETSSYPPIAPPRGLPDEWDALLAEEYDFRDMPDNVNVHHVSHLTLRELKESGYGEPMPLRGWVDEAEYEEMIRRTAAGRKYQLGFWDVKAGNFESRGCVLREWNGYLNLNLTSMIEKMERLKKERRIASDDEVRIVFWFDN